MASEVSICNLALGHLSNEANIASLAEQSQEAQYCAQFYPIARDELLSMHNWGFCTKRMQLSQLANDVDSWQYAYARPADCLSAIALLPPQSTDDTQMQDYVQELNSNDAQVLRTNVYQAVFKYTKKVTDTTTFSALFVTTLSYLLASYLAGPITKDMKLKETLYKLAMDKLADAATTDANDQENNAYGDKHVPTGLTGRSDSPTTLNSGTYYLP